MENTMSLAQLITAGCLIVIAAAHSALGESDILRPLFDASWKTPTPRPAMEKILRFAWHLTSLAWLALAAIALDVEPILAVGVVSSASAALIFVSLRGHLAWPIFLLAGLAAFRHDGVLSDGWLQVGAGATAILLLVAAAVHVYWAAGGRWFLDRALPTGDGTRFGPGPFLTLAVAVALATFGSLVAVESFGTDSTVVQVLVVAGVAAFVVRAIGDRRVAGFTKTIRGTDFAVADDRFFTPLVVFLALGASASLLV